MAGRDEDQGIIIIKSYVTHSSRAEQESQITKKNKIESEDKNILHLSVKPGKSRNSSIQKKVLYI